MENMRIKIEVEQDAIKYFFQHAIQEVEALREFYTMYRDAWTKSRLAFEQEYATALAINDAIIKLIDGGDPENGYSQLKNSYIGENKFEDIIELRFRRENESVQVGYAMKKNFVDQDPQKARSKQEKYDQQKEMFMRSILSNIVVIFESYLAQIFECMVVLNPEKYFEGRTIKINGLFSTSLKEIISSEVKKYVSDNMYDSLKTLDMMKNKSGFNIDRYAPIRDDFEEIYYRRNIFVHNSGIANDIYINSIAEKYGTLVQKGDKLVCDDVYIEKAIETLKKVVCVLLYEFLFVSNSENGSYDILGEMAFSSLSNQEYSFCEFVYNVLRRHKGFDFANKALYEVNYMIALKQQGKDITKNLEKFDTSAMQDQFVMAKYCLQDNNEAVYKVLNKIYPDRIPMEAIRDWPLFIDFRKSEEYKHFVSEHKQDFEVYAFEKSDVSKAEEVADVICDET